MPKFVIEREMPKVGSLSPDQLRERQKIPVRSCEI
jgi:hypothetical protein